MDFALTEEQLQLQDSLDRFLGDKSPLERVRDTVATGPTHDADVWQGLAELGVTGLLVPEEFGGAGLSLLDAALVAEVLGRHVTPVAWLSTAVLAPLAIKSAGSKEQQQQWLPGIADGSLQVAVAISEASGRREGAGVTFSDGKLNGRAMFVYGAADAGLVLVATEGGELCAVEKGAAGLEYTALRTIDDTQCLGELNFAAVPAQHLSAADAGLVASLQDAGRVILAADTLGAAQQMLEQAIVYAGERKQFNRVIASFQAVKHLCAEMAAELEPSRSLVWYAAHAYDVLPTESRLMACHAKAHLSEVGRFVARTATEVHGGMGFTDLVGLHYWFKRIGCNRQLLGSPERLRDDAARVQGWLATN
jgi:alkylation response protein AidB-like acyl-CoA dehydrogenase